MCLCWWYEVLAAAERRPRDPQGEEGNVAKEFINFFLFLCCLLCGVLIRCPFFVSQLLLSSAFKKLRCVSLLSKNTQNTSSELQKKRADTKNVAHVLCSSRESDGRRRQERQQQQRRRENNIAFNNNEQQQRGLGEGETTKNFSVVLVVEKGEHFAAVFDGCRSHEHDKQQRRRGERNEETVLSQDSAHDITKPLGSTRAHRRAKKLLLL
jgi:hypothetical protein